MRRLGSLRGIRLGLGLAQLGGLALAVAGDDARVQSLTCDVDACDITLKSGELYDEKNRLKPAFVATSALVVNAIPVVVAAPPGIYEYPTPPSWVGAARGGAHRG